MGAYSSSLCDIQLRHTSVRRSCRSERPFASTTVAQASAAAATSGAVTSAQPRPAQRSCCLHRCHFLSPGFRRHHPSIPLNGSKRLLMCEVVGGMSLCMTETSIQCLTYA
ncbi:hypothetical protein R6Z07F_020593 [Ovis aries]